jgi:predicted permease
MTLELLYQDLRLACRGLWRAKGFSAAALLMLALGIAGTTVTFSLIQGVLLRPMPVFDQDRLIVAWKEVRVSGSAQYPFGNTEIDSVAEASHLLESAAGIGRHGSLRSVVIDDGVASYVSVSLVTGGFFDVLGVRPLLGRTLARTDDVDGGENVLVISHGLWQRYYGASREVIGRRMILSDLPFTIVGVMPPDLDYPRGVEVWRLTRSMSTSGPFGDAARREVNLVARLRPGVTVEQARSELAALTRRLDAVAPPGYLRDLVPAVHALEDVVFGEARTPMLVLFGAVWFLLLIASANVANLLLMRGEGRRAELAVRAALGAARHRIMRLLFAESLVLAIAAGAAGLAIAWWSLDALITFVPDGLPRIESVRVDAAVVAFTIVTALVTATLAGLVPVLASVGADLVSELRSGGRGITGRRARHGRRTLVVAQVALAVTIVAAAGLLIRSVIRLQSVDIGLAADRLVLVDLKMPPGKYEGRARHAQFLDDVIAHLEAVPAIAAATPVNLAPFSGQGWDLPRFTAEGQTADQAAANPSLNVESIHPNYFETFEVPLVRGRAFAKADRQGAAQVAILSHDIAARTWPGEDPIGKRLTMGRPDSRDRWYTVVGVAAETRYRELARPTPTLYLPAAQFQMTAEMLVLRTTHPLDMVASLTRDRVRAVDPDVHVMRVVPFPEMLERPVARPKFNAFLLSIFGAAALILSTIGLSAVMSSYVRQRDREIALRLALGATASGVRRLVLSEALRLACLGAAIGLAAAAGATRLLRGMLFEVDPLDPSTILGAALLLIAASALASYVPAYRATRVDAVAILRSE